jgi:hypothetical protein
MPYRSYNIQNGVSQLLPLNTIFHNAFYCCTAHGLYSDGTGPPQDRWVSIVKGEGGQLSVDNLGEEATDIKEERATCGSGT